jgi:hypothetical protein
VPEDLRVQQQRSTSCRCEGASDHVRPPAGRTEIGQRQHGVEEPGGRRLVESEGSHEPRQEALAASFVARLAVQDLRDALDMCPKVGIDFESAAVDEVAEVDRALLHRFVTRVEHRQYGCTDDRRLDERTRVYPDGDVRSC